MSTDPTPAEQSLRAGQLADALTQLQSQVRQNPADGRLRVFLFQLHAILGNWEKAMNQLNVAADLDEGNKMMAQVCHTAIQCESLRAEVFAGKRAPLVFGEPEEWVGWMIRANELLAAGKDEAAATLRQQALEAAPAIEGTVNDKPFEWLADADSRMGPMTEAIIDGRYFWIPLQRIASLEIQPPADLRDLVWSPANFLWTNGGSTVGFIPTRYPGSELSDDPAIRLARKTNWSEQSGGAFLGTGQRVFATDDAEYPILEIRKITFNSPATQSSTLEPAPTEPSGR